MVECRLPAAGIGHRIVFAGRQMLSPYSGGRPVFNAKTPAPLILLSNARDRIAGELLTMTLNMSPTTPAGEVMLFTARARSGDAARYANPSVPAGGWPWMPTQTAVSPVSVSG